MWHEYEGLPESLLACEASELTRRLPGPALIHLPGRRPEPLFISVLLHGNESTGWLAVRKLLGRANLPRAVSLFVGNVAAAAVNRRYLDGQPDYNRIWGLPAMDAGAAERRMAAEVFARMRARGCFAAIDVHNNTGINPHYACLRRLDHRFFHLATLFSRTVVYFTKPDGVLIEPFSDLCPAVTVECGQPGQAHGVDHVRDYLDACLHLSELPTHPVPWQDIDLYHTVAIAKLADGVSVGLGDADTDLRLVSDLDHLNFRTLPVDTLVARLRPGHAGLGVQVWDESGTDVAERFLKREGDEIRTRVPVMPSMLTVNERAIRQDCLGYFMEQRKDLYLAARQVQTTIAED